MHRSVQFRPATDRDAEQVRLLVFSILEEYGLQSDPESTDSDLYDIEKSYVRGGGCFEVMVDAAGIIVGCYGLYPMGDQVCELRKMYLRRDCRGQGLGKATLRRALDQARRLGFRQMQLETATVLTEATTLYRSFGFRPFQPEHMSARCDLAMCMYLDPLPGPQPNR